MAKNSNGAFRVHLGLVLAEVICVPAFLFEVKRALGGNELSWAYVFEWPFLGCYAVYMWRKLLTEVHSESKSSAQAVAQEPATTSTATTRHGDDTDPQLQAWNDYLAKVHGHETGDSDQRRD